MNLERKVPCLEDQVGGVAMVLFMYSERVCGIFVLLW